MSLESGRDDSFRLAANRGQGDQAGECGLSQQEEEQAKRQGKFAGEIESLPGFWGEEPRIHEYVKS